MRLSELENQIDLPERPYFYLSYARAGAEERSKVQQFFEDLSDSIRIRAELPLTARVGCCDAAEHSNNREEALRTSRFMIALLSPAYFEDKVAGEEWQIFELRKAKATSDETKTLTRSIIPIPWSPYSGALPLVISQTPIFGKNLNGNHSHEPVGKMLRSPGKHGAYAEFVTSLADYIVTATTSFQLPELESTPDEVLNAFEAGVEGGGTSQPTDRSSNQKPNPNINQNVNQNLLIIDEAFIRGVAERIKETPPRPAPTSTVGFSGETTQSSKVAKEKYLVFAIDDEAEYIEKIETTARFSGDFDVKAYSDSNQLLDEVSDLLKDRQEPDLIVVNPVLTLPGTHRFKLIDALLEKKVPSAILALSKDPGARRSLESAGINDLVATLPEPFTSVDLLQRMRHWARTGRDKRYRRGRSDERPVFLSFSSPDEAMASKICKWLELREIGVWYSLTSLKPGDPWIEKVAQGLASAEVFIALISDHYPHSRFCQAELGVILDRNESTELRVIPVHYRLPTTALEDPQVKMLDRQAVTISDKDWLPGLQEILLSVQTFLKRHQN